jgi:hypothetical protein
LSDGIGSIATGGDIGCTHERGLDQRRVVVGQRHLDEDEADTGGRHHDEETRGEEPPTMTPEEGTTDSVRAGTGP